MYFRSDYSPRLKYWKLEKKMEIAHDYLCIIFKKGKSNRGCIPWHGHPNSFSKFEILSINSDKSFWMVGKTQSFWSSVFSRQNILHLVHPCSLLKNIPWNFLLKKQDKKGRNYDDCQIQRRQGNVNTIFQKLWGKVGM